MKIFIVFLLSLSIQPMLFAAELTKLEKEIVEIVKNAKSISNICDKGTIFKRTIRSGDGKYCTISLGAAVAELWCQDSRDFKSSSCHLEADRLIGGTNGATAYLKNRFGVEENLRKMLCENKNFKVHGADSVCAKKAIGTKVIN